MSTLLHENPSMEREQAACGARWLYVVSHTDPRYGGLSSAVPTLAASLATQAKIEIGLAAFCLPGEEHRPAALTDGQVRFWPTSRKAWMLDRPLKDNFAEAVRAADGLHIHGLWEESTATACRVAREQGKPYVLSAHGMLEPWALAAKGLKKRIYAALIERANVSGAACLHALTTAEAQQYRRFGAQGPIAVVPNAVALPATVDPDVFLASYPELRGKRLVLFLSRFHPKKGVDVLVEAWARVGKQHPEAHLVLAGPDFDGMAERLRQRCVAQGIDQQVLFPGMLAGEQKWSALAAAEAFVLPSHSEGLSMALLEAMGMGLPVIATRTCNMPEISTAQAGWETEPQVDALAETLQMLLSRTPADNGFTGRRGAELIASRYTQRQVTAQMAAVYAFVLGGPRPQGLDLLEGGR